MNLEFTLTYADFKSAFRLHRRQTFMRRLNRFIWPILTFVCFGIALVSNSKSELFAQALAFGVFCLWLSVALPIVRLIGVRRSFRRIVAKRSNDQRCFAIVDNTHVVTGVEGALELNYSWKRITGFAQDQKITLFYTSNCSFLFFPARAMTPEQEAELKAIVSSCVVKKQPC